MFILKFLSLNNIITYSIYGIFVTILLFLIYKYLYLEQSIYLLNSKIERLENNLSNFNPNLNFNSNCDSDCNSCPLNSSNMMKNAELIMNEIFNMDASYPSPSSSLSNQELKTKKNNQETEDIVPVLEEPINNSNLFDLKRSNNIREMKEMKEKKDREEGEEREEREQGEERELNDKESVISNIVGGGHAVKKNLMKLTIDKLKIKCEERKLSTEGTKNQLADRIIIYDTENSKE